MKPLIECDCNRWFYYMLLNVDCSSPAAASEVPEVEGPSPEDPEGDVHLCDLPRPIPIYGGQWTWMRMQGGADVREREGKGARQGDRQPVVDTSSRDVSPLSFLDSE